MWNAGPEPARIIELYTPYASSANSSDVHSATAGASSADAGGVAWEVLASLLLPGLVLWADPLDREQRQTEVADLGEQAVQGRLVGDRPGDQGLAGLVAADLKA
jgi:hypothetical protein